MTYKELKEEVKAMMVRGEKLHGLALEIAMDIALEEMEQKKKEETKC